MGLINGAINYILNHQSDFVQAVKVHLLLSFVALGIAILVSFPVGIYISHKARIAQVVINFFNAFRVLPSLAILFLALPYLGIGFYPSLVALTILAFPPILINTYTGIRSVNPPVVEAARGMGMSDFQVLTQIELPLAAPAIIAGVRTSTVVVISSATLAAFIGGGGLGDFITLGFDLYDVSIMLVGAVPVALLALISEGVLAGLSKLVEVKG